MDISQIIINGVVLGALYACIAAGFSLVWGVLNVINMLHGSFIILGGYLTYFAWHFGGVFPIVTLPVIAGLLFILGYILQYFLILFTLITCGPLVFFYTVVRTCERCNFLVVGV